MLAMSGSGVSQISSIAGEGSEKVGEHLLLILYSTSAGLRQQWCVARLRRLLY